MPHWWNRRSRVDRKRDETISSIEENRVAYEDMLRRAVAAGGVESRNASDVAERFRDLREKVQRATTEEDLEQLEEEAEALAQLRAYFCPEKEIVLEAKAHIFTLLDWGVSIKNVETLREATSAVAGVNIAAARGALHVIYEEYDSWDVYIDEYNRKTSRFTMIALGFICLAAVAALMMMFGWSSRILALVLASVAGALASVIARLPGVTTSDDWNVVLRIYLARIGTGIVASLVGIGLLGSGLITIALPKGWQTTDRLLEACLGSAAVSDAVQCTPGGALFILAVTTLLAFSERVLTSLESRTVPGTVRRPSADQPS